MQNNAPTSRVKPSVSNELKPIRIVASRKQDTIYIVEYAESRSAKETVVEKVKNLILSNLSK